jgi:cupin 2 domain-containing protein
MQLLQNIFECLPEDLDEEVVELLLTGDGIRIERIFSRGHTSPESGWYDQAEDEWVMVLKGAATLTLADGADLQLTVGSHISLPAHTKHRVKWTDPDTETIWLAVHFTASKGASSDT